MADICDMAQDIIERDLELRIAAARVALAPGEPGECLRCGEDSLRLVGGNCAPCRDRHGLQ